MIITLHFLEAINLYYKGIWIGRIENFDDEPLELKVTTSTTFKAISIKNQISKNGYSCVYYCDEFEEVLKEDN